VASSTAWQRGGVIVVVDVAVMVLVDVPVVDVFVVVAVAVVAVRVYVAVIITCFGVVPSDHETGCIGPYDQGLTDGAGWFCWELMPYWPDWSYCTLGSTAEAADALGHGGVVCPWVVSHASIGWPSLEHLNNLRLLRSGNGL